MRARIALLGLLAVLAVATTTTTTGALAQINLQSPTLSPTNTSTNTSGLYSRTTLPMLGSTTLLLTGITGVTTNVASDYNTLAGEMKTALGPRPGASDPDGQALWDTYDRIFTHGKAFAAAVVARIAGGKPPTVCDHCYPSIGKAYSESFTGVNRTAMAQALAAGRSYESSLSGDPFEPFEGDWLCRWHQPSGTGHVHYNFTHDWQKTQAIGGGVRAQPVAMTSGHPVLGLSVGGLMANDKSADAAINAVDANGLILGAVGVDGGKAQRPHAGFRLNAYTLLWIALEGTYESGGKTYYNYSVFLEIREDRAPKGNADRQLVDVRQTYTGTQLSPLYVIRAVEFTFDPSTTGAAALSSMKYKGGHLVRPDPTVGLLPEAARMKPFGDTTVATGANRPLTASKAVLRPIGTTTGSTLGGE